MAATVDQVDSDPASTSFLSPGPVTPRAIQRSSPVSDSGTTVSNQSPSTASTLPTIPSDEDRSSEDDGHATSSPRKGRSHSSSLSEPVATNAEDAVEKDALNGHANGNTNGTANGDTVKTRSRSGSSNVQRLSGTDLQQLASSPESLPIAPAPDRRTPDLENVSKFSDPRDPARPGLQHQHDARQAEALHQKAMAADARINANHHNVSRLWQSRDIGRRPSPSPRTLSTPPTSRTHSSMEVPATASSPRRYSFNPGSRPPPLSLNFDGDVHSKAKLAPAAATAPIAKESPALGSAAPIPVKIPLPPMSLPTHLQLEIAAQRPSPLYVYHPHTNDIPYESHAVKLERLKNVLLLPTYLEWTLNFGALACLDAFLHTFTILPIKFVIAVSVLVKWWVYVVTKEVKWLAFFVWDGVGRLRERGRANHSQRPGTAMSESGRSRSCSTASEFSVDVDSTPLARQRYPLRHRESHSGINGHAPMPQHQGPGPKTGIFRHRRTKSVPSNLTAFHKADLLQGAVIICSSMALMTLDASRMYHFIRAQSAIKLYVIYNILEVGDRLLSSLGQDILECLFSNETLSRNASGRSKVLLPLGMFALALVYSCLHSIALYYQVITLNVAVNSYSNALLTMLLSNQFVEIKSTVFKRIEKDNLFQLTCADVVERFQLWVMLFIIGMRNIVEVGGISIPGAGYDGLDDDGSSGSMPLHNPSILPHSFTLLPSWVVSGEVLSPFLIVVGSEMLVDTIKHAYVTKFNNIKPTFYSRILDILCKDYYTNAFMTPTLTRRFGLAVIPLSCLFIRASFQTYHMFLSTHLPMPMPPSTQTSLSEESATPSSPAMMAALNRFDSLLRDSLGRATYGYPYGSPLNSRPWYSWTSDDWIATITMVVFFFITFLVLLILKLLLGMVLLKYSRNRYAQMRHMDRLVASGQAERESYDTTGRRTGGHGKVEVGDERQRWIHSDPTEGLKGGKGPGGKRSAADTTKPEDNDYNGASRYEMVAKRIW